jgi:hypothetical protein
MANSKHFGAFAGGFAKSFTEMMKLYLMQQHYDALNKHYAAQEALWANRGLGRNKGLTPAEIAAGQAAGRDWDKGGSGGGGGGGGYGGGVSGKFWTPENQQHAYNVLMDSGKFSEYGAAGAVARMTREAPDGPTSVNPSSKAFGIAQWLGDRKTPIAGNTNFDDQLKYYAGADLDAPEQARAKEQFKNAASPEEGSYAAMHFERAGGYKESGGRSDVLLNSTPTSSVYATVHGGDTATRTAAASPSVKSATMNTDGYQQTVDKGGGANTGPNGVYANIPVKDDKGRDQLPMFTRWNPDPVGNEAANLKQINPDMQKVIARARADNPDLKFVLGNGKRSAVDQDWAKSVGWSQVGSKDGGDASVHMKGNAADLWALDGNNRVTFDPAAQSKVTAAIKTAAKEEGVKLNAGDDWRHPDKPHFELASPTTTAKTPTKGPNKDKVAQAAPEGPPVLHTPYQVAGPADGVTEAGAEKAARTLAEHRAAPDAKPSDTDDTPFNETSIAARARDMQRNTSDQSDTRVPVEAAPIDDSTLGNEPSIAARGRQLGIPERPDLGPPQRTGAPPNVGMTPSSVPDRPVMGPPQRTGAPPNVGPTPSSVPEPPTPQMGPEGGGRTTLPMGPATRADDGARPDLTARSPSVEANKPSPDATPVSATRAIPATPAQDPRFVQIDAPNQGPNVRGQPRQMTAIDLSHLWGPNPPVSQAAPTPAPPPPPVAMRRPDDQDFAVGAPNMDDMTLGMQLGAAKGGPITQRVSLAKGGALPSRPTMAYAGAGGVQLTSWQPTTSPTPYTTYQGPVGSPAPTTVQPSMGGLSSVGAYANSQLGYQPWNSAQWLAAQPTSTGGLAATMSGPGTTADINALTPAQQQWYNEQNANEIAGGGRASWYYNPASYPTTPAAAAAAAPAAATPSPTIVNPPSVQNITNYPTSTTVTDPTSTTTTGTPGVSNVITANSYDPNVIGTTGSGSATDSSGSTNYSVDDKDTTKQILSRKGGPIKRFAAGGAIPATAFATGGGLTTNPAGATAVMNAIWGGTYNGPTATGGWMGTPYAQLAPNQQAWADQQSKAWAGTNQGTAALNAQGINPTYPASQLSLMPNAVWPTTTPAAPTPLNEPGASAQTITTPQVDITGIDPTSTTTTGIPGVPTTGTLAKTYDPNNIATTGTGSATDSSGSTNYSTDPKDQTTQILSRKGGPITRRVNRYDDGGGVSPSVAGAPPGATGGGAIPPIYYNPATYAAAGAPVGKGVSQTSAPTFGAGAIPSLPMARGGSVAFDDGGDVSAGDTAPDYSEERQTAGDDQMTTALLDQRDAAANAPPSMAQDGYYTPADYQTPAPSQAGPSSVSPITPEISDGQGNPSKGLISAIGDGLHWLGDHLGIGGAQAAPAIARDPQTQGNRQGFVQGKNVGDMDASIHNEIANTIDPNHSLNDAERQIAVMEGTYRYMLSQGNSEGAGRMAASILQYSVQTSQKFAEEAAKQLYDGNLKGAVDNINHASDAVPDGRQTHVHLNDDGTAIVEAKGMDGRVLWQHKGSAAAILQYATNRGRTGQMQWDALEEQAGKYDPTFRDMATNRQKNVIAQGKEDAQTASETRVANAVGGNELQPVTRVGKTDQSPTETPASSATAPTPTPASATASATASASPDSASAAPTADGTAPTGAGGKGPTGHGGGLPPPPSPADRPNPTAPTPDGQDVSFDSIAARINNQEQQTNASDAATIRSRYQTPEGYIHIDGQDWARPAPPNLQGLSRQEQTQAIQAYEKGPLAQYNDKAKRAQDAMNKDIADNRDIRSKQFQTLRDQAGREFTEGQTNKRETFTQEQTNKREAFTQGEADKRMQYDTDAKALAVKTAEEHAARAPRPDTDVQRTFSTQTDANGKITGKQPADFYKDQASTMPDGTVNPDQKFRDDHYNSEFGDRNQRMVMDNALVNGYRYTHDAEPAAIADALRGFVLNSYTATTAAVPEDGYGPRYAVTITRPSDGSRETVVLPRNDWANVLNMQRAKATLATRNQADTAAVANNPYRPPIPDNAGQSAGTPISKALGWQRGGAIPSSPMQRYG